MALEAASMPLSSEAVSDSSVGVEDGRVAGEPVGAGARGADDGPTSMRRPSFNYEPNGFTGDPGRARADSAAGATAAVDATGTDGRATVADPAAAGDIKAVHNAAAADTTAAAGCPPELGDPAATGKAATAYSSAAAGSAAELHDGEAAKRAAAADSTPADGNAPKVDDPATADSTASDGSPPAVECPATANDSTMVYRPADVGGSATHPRIPSSIEFSI